MVSAAMAWVRAARPELTPDRVVQAVRLGARDVEQPGLGPADRLRRPQRRQLADPPGRQLPIPDPLEPNDNLVWVNGTAFGKRAPAVWSGGAPSALDALLDKQEDPVDVYRIVIPAPAARRGSR